MASDPRIRRFLDQYSTICSLLAIGFGLVVLVGWAFHLQILKSFVPGQVAVKPNTAVGFILLGIAWWLLKKEHPELHKVWAWLARFMALITSTIGLVSFLEYWRGWDLGIDQLLFKTPAADALGSVRPGLMSPITAAGFLLLGLSLPLLDFRHVVWRWLAQTLTIGVAIVCMFGILDFVLDFNTGHTFIALPTAMLLFLFSSAVVSARSGRGLGRLLVSTTIGGTLARRLLPASIIVPVVIAWLRTSGQAAGLFSEWAGVAIMTVSAATLLSVITAWTALVIDGSEGQRQQAQEAERRLASIVMSSHDAIIGKTLEGIVTSWNPGAEDLYGYSAQEMIGQSIAISFPPDRLGELQTILQIIQRGEQVQHFETIRLRKGGQPFHVSISVSPLKGEKGEIVGASTIARDITARKQAEEKVACVNRTLRALSECAEKVMRATDEAMMLQQVCDVIVRVAAYRMVWVGYAEQDEKKTVRAMAVAGFEDGYLKEANVSWADVDRGRGPTGTCIRSGRTCVCQDAMSDARLAPWREQAIRQGFRSSVGVPLKIGNEVIGALTVYAAELGRFEVEEQRLLEQLASNLTYAIVTLRARAERAHAEQELREASLYTRSLIEASLDPLVTISKDGKIMDVNRATEKVTGVAREELVGSDFSNYFTEPEKARHGYQQVYEKGFVHDYALAIRHVSGRTTDVMYNASIFANESGQVQGVFAAARDVTLRKQAEEEVLKLNRELELRVQQRTAELRESEQRVRRKLDSILTPEGDLGQLELGDLLDIPAVQAMAEDFYKLAHIPMFILDLQGNAVVAAGWQEICTKFHRVNPETCRNCRESDMALSQGVPPGEFKLYECKNNMYDVVTPITVGGEHVGNLFSGQFFFQDEAVDVSAFRSQAKQYGFKEEDYIAALERAPRLSREAMDAGMAFFIKFAQLFSRLGYSGIKLARSVEEIRRVNADLAASVKELEAFTYSVSHDLRAPLRHITGFSKLLMEEYGPSLPPDAQHHLQRIEEGTRRMGQLVDDLLNLARVGRRDLDLQVTGLQSLVAHSIEEIQPDCEGREIDWKIGNLPYVECDPGLMKQVFLNLLSNAVKFTRPRERAVIEIGQKQENEIPIIYIRDNGVGFSMKYVDKLFGVFQRLHRTEDFDGTGVGLATVKRIIQKHGGTIWVEAELDKGATFYFTLGKSEKNETKAAELAAGGKA